MKNGDYIHFQGRTSIGVSKKIDMQLKEFRRFYDMEEKEVETVPRNLFQRILGLFPTASIGRDYKKALDSMEQPDFIYARRTVADRAYVNFWKEIKKKYPGCKIIIEIFTYPYDKDDFGKWNAWPFYIKEIIYRRKLKKYVDRFVTYSDDDVIFGVPAIKTMNGIDVGSFKPVSGRHRGEGVGLLAIAYMQKHHGYERIIKGMETYYHGNPKREVILYMVGDGPEKKKYVELAEKYSLTDYIRFYPTLKGEKLDEMYEYADVALASFGMYKLGINRLSALKTREYLAKGLPIATGCPIDILDKNEYPYVCEFENGSMEVDIQKLIDFVDKIDQHGREKVLKEIRSFAERTVDMKAAMAPIIRFIEITEGREW